MLLFCQGSNRSSHIRAILALGMFVSACSSTVPVSSPLERPPLVEKIPVTVRILYADSLSHHQCTAGKGYISAAWSIALGSPSIEMFDGIFAALFDKPLTGDGSSQGAASNARAPLIEVRLLEYDGCEARWPIVGTTTVRITYEATLRDREGNLIARWQGRGKAMPADYASAVPGNEMVASIEMQYLSTMTRLAMRRAAADFIINFEKEPGIRAWLGK